MMLPGRVLTLLLAGAAPQAVLAHGGVALEDDLCVIKISYLKAHFKIYQPRVHEHRQFCEDLPDATESLFVMEYLHDSLRESPIELRIIRNVTGKGRFARLEDVGSIDDLDVVTVFHREPSIDPDVFSVRHEFAEEGDYIGIVTVSPPGSAAVQTAVFPFAVGFTGFGYWPVLAGLLVLLQLQYFIMSGRFRRRHKIEKPKLTVVHGGRDAN